MEEKAKEQQWNTEEGKNLEEQRDEGSVKVTKIRIWQFLTLIIAFLFVFSIFTNGFRFGESGGADEIW